MMIEQLIFTIFAFGLFVYIFFKMIQKNDTNYIGILALEAIGIALNLIAVITQSMMESIMGFSDFCIIYPCLS